MKDLENWYIFVFNNSRGVFTPPLLTKNHDLDSFVIAKLLHNNKLPAMQVEEKSFSSK